MKRFIDVHIPVRRCNLNCHYCYIAHENQRNTVENSYKYSVETIKKGLSKERMGGLCHFNLCGMGETLIPQEIVDIARAILEQGHYVMIVTNGLATHRFKQFAMFPTDLRERLGFKFSFHYLELIRKNLTEKFFSNIQIVRNSNMSFSLEMTPSDELEPYIEDIKKICLENVGALCHLTIPRDMTKENIVLLSKHNLNEFYKIWHIFDSEMFEYKYTLWGKKRNEFCYAGEWSGMLDISTGYLSQCYGVCMKQNIFKDTTKPIKWRAIGHKCSLPHCYNAHSLLGLGCIPELIGNYALERDRIDKHTGKHWLTEKMYDFLSCDLTLDNQLKTDNEKKITDIITSSYQLKGKCKHIIKNTIESMQGKIDKNE